ncbi:HD-GYP domain-containing protein [Solibacillus daqui]|uniref:HD-GYP domain-containing protein n=1 Tax=Solibacillus daqui TaxID=2912187 RepID=UPI0023654879|nr:HD domain-containing phosphohydrolase [Solibacillus daqui]
MPKIEQLLLQDIVPGDILAADIYVDRQLIMTKGSPITEKAIDLLKRKSVQFVSIYYNEQVMAPIDINIPNVKSETLQPTESLTFNFAAISEDNYETFDFYAILAELDIEIRYGEILKDEKKIDYLQKLLAKILSNSDYKNYLMQLRTWDHHSYLHSIDAYIIGTLFALHLNLKNIERLAIGYLLHDIGKLKTPRTILSKPGRLTAHEYEEMKMHTLHGEEIFKQIGLTDLAYIAKSHHERRNGEGYPESVPTIFTTELELLQIIDVYSATTMKRTYRDAMRAADAFSLLYRDEEKFNDSLLTLFVDFIGIYPVNSIVLLSDGYHGIVEKTNPQFPTSPRVKCMETNTSFHISINNDITIVKMISHQTEDKSELLNTFYNELASANVESAKKTYLKIVDNFKVIEYFTKIFIPVYQILNLLHMQKAISDKKHADVINYMKQLMQQKVNEQIENNLYKENVLILVDDQFKNDYFFSVFLGLIHNDRVMPHIMPINANLELILNKLDTVEFTTTCVISNSNTDTLLLSYLPNMYEVPKNKIENYLIGLIGDNKDVFNFHYLLEDLAVEQPFVFN